MMTNGGREGRIFLSHFHANNGFCNFLTTKYLIFIFEKKNKNKSRKSEYTEMRLFATVVPTKSDSDVILCLQLLSKTLTCTLHLMYENRSITCLLILSCG